MRTLFVTIVLGYIRRDEVQRKKAMETKDTVLDSAYRLTLSFANQMLRLVRELINKEAKNDTFWRGHERT